MVPIADIYTRGNRIGISTGIKGTLGADIITALIF